eukprot:3738700-Pyramimonas_sp.AAC.1
MGVVALPLHNHAWLPAPCCPRKLVTSTTLRKVNVKKTSKYACEDMWRQRRSEIFAESRLTHTP